MRVLPAGGRADLDFLPGCCGYSSRKGTRRRLASCRIGQWEGPTMIRCIAVIIISLGLTPAALAAEINAGKINDAAFPAKQSEHKLQPANVRVQIMLDRSGFSPGEIDGRFGENAQRALAVFAEANSLPSKGLTHEVWDKLTSMSNDPVIVEYKISDKD